MKSSNAALDSDRDSALWSQLPAEATDENYCASWLSLQCGMIPGVTAGSVLLGSPDRGPYLFAANWPNGQDNKQQLAPTATQALQERSCMIVQRTARPDSNGSSQQWYEVAYPILVANRLYGVAVLKVSARPQAQLQAVLQQLSWGAAWLEVLVHRQNSKAHDAKNERLQMVLDALAPVLEHDKFIEAATALVTDLSVRLMCERVSLGFGDGRDIHVKAMSHSARFGKRANLTRAVEAAMEEASDQETCVIFPPESGTSLQFTRHHQDLAQQHGAGAVCSVPLGREGQIYGVLTFERLADNPFDRATVELCEAIAGLAGPILELKLSEDKSLKKRTLEALRKRMALLLGSGQIAPKMAAIGLLLALALSSAVTARYRVPAKTLIEAQTQRVAVAPFNGYIATARVRAGDVVRAGEILATLDNRDLKLEQLKWSSQKEQYEKQYNLAMAQRNAAQVKITAAQVAQADAELSLIDDQLARTHVRAPIDGLVVSGDLSQSIGAPAERGQVLFEVAPLDAYRVILQVDEREAAEVTLGQTGRIALSAFPTTPLDFVVDKITPVSAARDGRNYFRIEAKMDKAPAQLRPGMEGVGKIDIGQRRLIWLWTHRGVDWFRLWIWSWMP
jgi:biotin carboxyl carrier protein